MKKKQLVYVVLIMLVGALLTACGDSDTEDKSDEKDSFTVGVVNYVPVVFSDIVDGFKDSLAENGYVEGENITYVMASTAEELDQNTNIRDLDLIMMVPTGSGEDYLQPLLDLVGDDVPIVFDMGSTNDLISNGYIESATHPGKQVTGISIIESDQRRFEIFIDMLTPDMKRICVVYDPLQDNAATVIEGIKRIAEENDVEIHDMAIVDGNTAEMQEAVDALPDDIDALFTVKIWMNSQMWFDVAKERRLPLSFDGESGISAEWFGVMSYGPIMYESGRQAANPAIQILKGANPGDLPVEDTDAYLTVDLGVADVVGLEISDEMLRRAKTIQRTEVDLDRDNSTDEDVVAEAGSGACMTSITSPGGTNAACVTTTCDNLEDSNFVTYGDRVDVAACPTESLVGVCAAEVFDSHYYDGDPSLLETGCGFMSGTWTEPTE